MRIFLAATEVKIDPAINEGFALFFVLLIIMCVGLVAWQYFPVIYKKYKEKRLNKNFAENSLKFDSDESILYRGDKSLRIEPKSIQYFVCKFTFNNPYKSFEDGDILDARDHEKESRRSVYHAVRSLNSKSKASLKLDSDLFKYSNNSTIVNKPYRPHITK